MPPSHRSRRADGRLSAAGPFFAWLVLCGCLLAALVIWRGRSYWNYSDGVYLLSGRGWLDGWAPYGDFAAAQPPGIYVVSAGLLGIHDAVGTVRVALAFVDLLTAGLVGWTVWRLARDRWVAVVAGVLAPLPLMTLHETAQLTPETLAAPLVMAATLLAARRSTSAVAGVAGAGMIMLKLAFAVPALAIALASQGRRRALAGLGAAVGVMAGASWLVFGSSLWREIVVAQLASGRASVHAISGLWAQAAWNAVPLLGGCAAALVLRRRSSDPPLLRALAAAGGGALILTFMVVKRGTWINGLAVAEPPLLALAVPGLVWLAREALADRRARAALIVAGGLALLGLAQSASLLVAPNDPAVSTRPFAASGPRRELSAGQVDALVAAARRCPAKQAYAGTPYVAFLARRRLPGRQPDPFITAVSTNRRFARLADADRSRCAA